MKKRGKTYIAEENIKPGLVYIKNGKVYNTKPEDIKNIRLVEPERPHSKKCQVGQKSALGTPLVCDCDGYHTFNELYNHRHTLYVVLCKFMAERTFKFIWRSTVHSDLTRYDGWFILGIGDRKGTQITYHLPMSWWDKTNFAVTLKKAPKFDGHTSDDVLARLEKLLK